MRGVVSGTSQLSPTWLPEHRQVGLATRKLCVGEQHDTILGSFVEAKHSLLVIFHWKKTKQKWPEFVSEQPRAADRWSKESTSQKKGVQRPKEGVWAFPNEFRFVTRAQAPRSSLLWGLEFP